VSSERIGLSDDKWALGRPYCRPSKAKAAAPQMIAGATSKALHRQRGRVRNDGTCLASTVGEAALSGTSGWIPAEAFEAMLKAFAEAVEHNTRADRIDTTVVRAHHCAVGP